jgi:tRNA/rRNA methyltransferase
VLVRPQLGENIGATARAMLNFGLADMRLVSPRDGWPNERATAMASGAQIVLDRAQVFDTTRAALADCEFVLATTARPRECRLPVYDPAAAASEMKTRIDRGERCAVMFGPERSGLENEDVLRADTIISIPVNPSFASLNIAQAALVIAYEWARADGREASPGALDAEPPAPREAFEGLIDHLFAELTTRGYFHPAERRPVMEMKIRAALARAGLTEAETRTLRGVVKSLSLPPRKDKKS